MQIKKDWKSLEPKDRIILFEKLLKYSLPALTATTITTDFDKLTNEQLDVVVKELFNIIKLIHSMEKIILEKETKIKLLNAIAAGELDLDNFPEITANFPQIQLIDAKTLTDEQLNRIIENTTGKKYYE